MTLLEGIKAPEDVKKLSAAQIPKLCAEIRERIIGVTLKNGGHLASSLGAVELSAALLRIFDPSQDKIIFDVGHQSYAWKILTGRNDSFDTLRRQGGVSGFPKKNESRYDHFGVGHSSTSLSAALGFAASRELKGEKHHVVAVIGDGALINGEALEALNHAGELDIPVIFVLNDNAMSISPRVGGLALHLARLSTSAIYKGTKRVAKKLTQNLSSDGIYRALKSTKNAMKKAVSRGNLFNDLGLTYWGPFDGHDEAELERVFELAKLYDGPLLIHVITKKGKGYAPAEADPVTYHGIPAGGIENFHPTETWSAAAAGCIEKLLRQDARSVVLTPAMAEGSSLGKIREIYPDRFFDVGIAEEHMMTFAAGLAVGGLRPVACFYSTFLQRAVDQLVHDVCLQKLPVIIAVDRAGFVGDDGETHQGLFDMNWASVVPNLQVWAPFDLASLQCAFESAAKAEGPVLIRYPGGKISRPLRRDEKNSAECTFIERGKLCIASVGSACKIAADAARLLKGRGLGEPSLAFINRVSPLPDGLLDFLRDKELVVFVEEAYRRGGVGEHLTAVCAEAGLKCRIKIFALPSEFVAQGTQDEQRARYGLTPEKIVEFCELENGR